MRRREFVGGVVGAAAWPVQAQSQFSQKDGLKERLTGSWTLVSMQTSHPGVRSAPGIRTEERVERGFRANPQGSLIFAENGRFILVALSPEVSKFVNSDDPTAEELTAVAKGTLALFGTYLIRNEENQRVEIVIEASSRPDISRHMKYIQIKTVTGTELTFVTVPPPGGGQRSDFVYRRD